MKDIDNYHAREALCPFYVRCSDKDGIYSVHCKGLIEDGGIICWFRHPENREIQFESFCAKKYGNCEIYQAIMKAGFADD